MHRYSKLHVSANCRVLLVTAAQGGKAGLADYLNTNPIEVHVLLVLLRLIESVCRPSCGSGSMGIEVLKSHVVPEPCTGLRLIFYRPDKEYLPLGKDLNAALGEWHVACGRCCRVNVQ